MKAKKVMPKANKIIADGFKKLNPQISKSDAKTIEDKTGIAATWVREYFKGNVADFNTGSIILTELRRLVSDREQYATELVA